MDKEWIVDEEDLSRNISLCDLGRSSSNKDLLKQLRSHLPKILKILSLSKIYQAQSPTFFSERRLLLVIQVKIPFPRNSHHLWAIP
jgi:hypothetical protein